MARSLTAGVAGLLLSGVCFAQPPGPPASLPPGPAAPGPLPPRPAAVAAADEAPVGPAYATGTAATDSNRFWVGAEALGWWVRGQSLPALVTTSRPGTPIGSAGVLGVPTTAVLAGNERVNGDARFGGRFTAGVWLDDCQRCGVAGEFFILSQSGNTFSASSQGTPILARPFTTFPSGTPDAQIIAFPGGAPNAQLVAFPGAAAGSVRVDSSSNLLGAGVHSLHQLCCGCNYRVYALAGYRYLRLSDRVGIAEQVTATGAVPGGVAPGTSFVVTDNFRTVNQFHGADLGLSARVYNGPLFVDATARLGIGGNARDLTAEGATVIAPPGQRPTTLPGGLLVPGAGRRESDTAFALVPDLRLNLGYRVSDRLDVFVGYNVLWWTNVIRAGDQIDLRVNPGLLPPPVVTGPLPVLPVSETTIWAQGISLGLMGRF